MQQELTLRERDVLERRYGLKGNKEETQRQVAKSMGISRSLCIPNREKSVRKIAKENVPMKTGNKQARGQIGNKKTGFSYPVF